MKTHNLSKIAGLLLLGTTSIASADVALTYSNPAAANENMTLTVTNNRAAVSFSDGRGEAMRMIFDKAADQLLMVMDGQKQYVDMEQMMQGLSGLSGMLSGMMKDLPEDTQGQLGGLLGGLVGGDTQVAVPEPTFKETGKSEKIAGFSCDVAIMTTQGVSTEMCLADPESIGVTNADFEIMRAMMRKQQESAKQAMDMLGVQDFGFNPGDIDRVPLRVKQLGGQGAGSVFQIKGLSQEIDSAAVVIPEGYGMMKLPSLQ